MVSEGIFQTAPDGHFIMVNNALARMYGYASPEDLMRSLVGITKQHYVDPLRRAEFLRLLKEEGVVYNFEAQMVKKDRNLIWVSVNARSVRDRKKVLYYEGTATDITTRKRLEAELAHSRKNRDHGAARRRNSPQFQQPPYRSSWGSSSCSCRGTTSGGSMTARHAP